MGWAAAIPALVQAAGASQGGSVSPGQSTPSNPAGGADYNQRNQISIAPVGVNLGAILAPFIGSPQNGGAGMDVPSPMQYMGRNYTQQTVDTLTNAAGTVQQPKSNILPLIVAVGGAILIAVMVAKGVK